MKTKAKKYYMCKIKSYNYLFQQVITNYITITNIELENNRKDIISYFEITRDDFLSADLWERNEAGYIYYEDMVKKYGIENIE